MYSKSKTVVYRFKITLLDVEKPIWRRIEVPANYAFWDLHVAIQDAMGWFDYHLHEFTFRPKHKRKKIFIGFPDEMEPDRVLPSWETALGIYLHDPGMVMEYTYDFGDNWQHEIVFEGILMRYKGVKYPRCLDGVGACPPEDVGGVGGYEHLLKVLQGPKDKNYESYKDWLKHHVTCYWPFKPEQFEPESVIFTNSSRRLNRLLGL